MIRLKRNIICGLFAICILFCGDRYVFANNLRITNATIYSQDTTSTTKTITVQFDVAWDNSWNDSAAYSSHDALWVFMKYSSDDGVTWKHATLYGTGENPAGYSVGTAASSGYSAPASIVVSNDKKGCFLKGASNLSATDVRIVWEYGTDFTGSQDPWTANLLVKIFGIEMVYVSSGAFYAGDGNPAALSGAFQQGPSNTSAWYVQGEGAISVTADGSSGYYYVQDNGHADDDATAAAFTIPADFPKGTKPFYAMKYEITQQQYADFLNTLTRSQQANRVAADVTVDSPTNVYVMSNAASVTYRNTVQCPSSGNGTSSPVVFFSAVTSGGTDARQHRACNYLSWQDMTAYADWAGLRPMTELEFEKVSRGTASVVSGAYAWQTTTINPSSVPTQLTISGTEDGTEYISSPTANCHYGDANTSPPPPQAYTFSGGDTGAGPLRVGIFSKSGTSAESAGVSLCGARDLSGNLFERCVTVGNSTGRLFAGTHGDGVLSSDGYANNSDWPGYVSNKISGASGSGLRGGSWIDGAARCITSDRYYGATNSSSDSLFSIVVSGRHPLGGGRLVRTEQ